jgi:hypothetical protein
LQAANPAAGQIDGHEAAGAFHGVRQIEGFAPGGGAEVEHGFTGLWSEQGGGEAGGGVLDVGGSLVQVGKHRFLPGGLSGDFVKERPVRGLETGGADDAGVVDFHISGWQALIPFEQSGAIFGELLLPAGDQPFRVAVIGRGG